MSIRELEVLKLLGQGKTSKEIAVLLTVSVETVRSHRKSICRKLDAHSTAELIRHGAFHWVSGVVFRPVLT